MVVYSGDKIYWGRIEKNVMVPVSVSMVVVVFVAKVADFAIVVAYGTAESTQFEQRPCVPTLIKGQTPNFFSISPGSIASRWFVNLEIQSTLEGVKRGLSKVLTH